MAICELYICNILSLYYIPLSCSDMVLVCVLEFCGIYLSGARNEVPNDRIIIRCLTSTSCVNVPKLSAHRPEILENW